MANTPQQHAPPQPLNAVVPSGFLCAPPTEPASFRHTSQTQLEPLGPAQGPPPFGGPPDYVQHPHLQPPAQCHHQVPQHGGPHQFETVGFRPQSMSTCARVQSRPHSHQSLGRNKGTFSRWSLHKPHKQTEQHYKKIVLARTTATWEPLPLARQMPFSNQQLFPQPLTVPSLPVQMLTQESSQNTLSPAVPQLSVKWQQYNPPQHESARTAPSHVPSSADLNQTDRSANGTTLPSARLASPFDPTRIDSKIHAKTLQESAGDELSSLDLDSSRSIDPAPSAEEEAWMKKAEAYVTQFQEHFTKHFTAMESFEILCHDYKNDAIDEVQFYVGVQDLLSRDNALDLMSGFHVFLPALWKDVDLTWLDKAVDFDRLEKNRMPPIGQVDVAAEMALSGQAKKKRPMNGFSTTDAPDAPSRRESTILESPPPTPMTAVPDRSKGKGKAKAHQDKSALAKLPVKLGSGRAIASSSKTWRSQSTISAEDPADTLRDMHDTQSPEPSALKKKGKNRYGLLLASQVEHFGPVFESRRAILGRTSRSYIHLCGARFTHPMDVKAHHKKYATHCLPQAGYEAKGSQWNDHPSCQVDYPTINYTKVKDGFVLLDQESYDKLEDCERAGLQWVAQNGVSGAEVNMKVGGDMDGGHYEDDGGFGEEDINYELIEF